ncbi:MAG: hypothetical protein DRP66_02790 [Planctomycetota bacterium]|nr:MAG: hypothetical protein DRP66_02790 [Planctomycetota bacterium]
MSARQKTRGFTLIELLVVIAIIALLLSILVPSLNMAKEIARRLICSTQLKSFGVGLHLYSESHNEKAIPNSSSNGNEFFDGINSGYQPWWSYVIGDDTGASDPDLLKAFNHGKLYELQYLDVPDLFYCPSAKLTLKSLGGKYAPNYYFENVVRSMPPHKSSGWGGPAGDLRCRSSYCYWTWEETSFLKLTNKPVVVDSLVRIPHRKRGRSFAGDVDGKPFGVNALFGDGHVNMTLISNTPEILDYINQASWDIRARDYNGFVGALRMMKP